VERPESITISSWFGPIRIVPDPEFRQLRPTWKVRGRRKYYRTLLRDAERFAVHPSGWYDLMHWHADWWGLGNLRWSERREHLVAVFTMFRRVINETSKWDSLHQVWLLIDPYDSSQDAVYLHTPNPNAENFPYQFEGVAWDVDIPDRLHEFITEPSWQFGRAESRGTYFIVRPRAEFDD
jgi:hypothetical protein